MQQRIDKKAKTASYHFDSLYELARWIEDTKPTWSSTSSYRYPPKQSWDLKAGYQGALKMARDGWIEGAQKAQEALKVFVPQSPAPNLRTDFYGHLPHVPRYCAGAPDSMIRHEKTYGTGKVITLIVPVNAGAMTDAQSMANFGLGIAQYIRQLETQGNRVELWAAQNCAMGTWHYTATIVIKKASQPLDLAVIAFAIGHPAMLRRIGFACYERCACPEYFTYGSPRDLTLATIINPPHGAIILNGMRQANQHATTAEKALEYVKERIEAAMADNQARS